MSIRLKVSYTSEDEREQLLSRLRPYITKIGSIYKDPKRAYCRTYIDLKIPSTNQNKFCNGNENSCNTPLDEV